MADTPFDRAFLVDPVDKHVNIDDLLFGPPIPVGAMPLLGVAAFVRRRRRRR